VRRVAMNEGVVLVRGRVVPVQAAVLDRLAPAGRGLVPETAHIDDRFLELGEGGDVLDEVVTGAGRNLGGEGGGDIGRVAVVDRDLDAVGLAPFLDALAEPLVVGSDEVAPLEN